MEVVEPPRRPVPPELGRIRVHGRGGEEHLAELRELLDSAGIDDVDPGTFRRYGSARRLYNFNIDNAY